jgi:hypothetical protein
MRERLERDGRGFRKFVGDLKGWQYCPQISNAFADPSSTRSLVEICALAPVPVLLVLGCVVFVLADLGVVWASAMRHVMRQASKEQSGQMFLSTEKWNSQL